jgi:hypothetical protein
MYLYGARPCSQKPTSGTCSEQGESSEHPYTLFPQNRFNITFPRLCSPKWILPITSSPKYAVLIHLSHASNMVHSFHLVNFILLPTTDEEQKLCMTTVQQEILFNLPLLQFSAVLTHAQVCLSTVISTSHVT